MKKPKLSSWGYKCFKPILAPIFKLYYHPTIINKENIPKTGPIIIVGNHKHLMDQCLVIIATKRIVHYMAKKEYFDGPYAWFFKATGCISVNRSIYDKEAKGQAKMVLDEGGAIGLFPEGTRNRTDKVLLPFKFGAVSLAQKTGATIVPFGITGDYKFRSKNLKIKFGKPFPIGNKDLTQANQFLENEVKKLISK